MSDSNIIDLDILVPVDKVARLGGVAYTIPGDMPMVTYLKMNQLGVMQERDAPQEELVAALVDAITELFTWQLTDRGLHEEAKTVADQLDAKLRRLSVTNVTQFLAHLYPPDEEGPAEGDVEAPPVDPPAPASDGTTTTPTTTPPPTPDATPSPVSGS